jgi:chromosome segregation ATPase
MRMIQAIATFTATALFTVSAAFAAEAQKPGGLVCWKDKAGKTVGCGDKVPPEYQDNAASTLNKRGETVKQNEAALTPEQRKAQQAEADRKQQEEQQRAEEKRRDRALLDSFTNEKEIDLKRARDIQQIEVNISAQQSNVKSLTDRQNETRAKIDAAKKDNKPVAPALQQEYDKQTADLAKLQEHIAQKRKEIADKNVEYDAMKKRFIELKGGSAAPAKT